MRLTTPRLDLREWDAADLDDVYAFRSDPEVARFMDFRPETLEQTRAWLDFALAHKRRRPRDGWNLGIALRESGRAIGWLGFGESSRYPKGSGEHGVGYMLARDWWGRGYAAEAVRAALGHMFGALGARRVSAWCWADNAASARVMEKAAMTFVRRYEEREPKSGEEREAVEYAVRAEEWTEMSLVRRD